MAYYNRPSGGLRPDDYGGGGGRWDRDRFERVRAKSRGAEVRDSYRFVEDDRYNRRGSRVDIDIDESYDRRGPRGRVDVRERDRYEYDVDDYAPPRRRRPEFLDDDMVEVRERRLAPYAPRYERDEDLPYRPARPAYVRRQSSLDTMDRRPRPRYGDRDIEVDIQVRPPRDDYEERDFRSDDRRFEEDYRDVRIRRDRERSTYRMSSEKYREPEFSPPREVRGSRFTKRGRTRMPKRLVQKRAVVELGLPYEEDVSIMQIPYLVSLT